MLNCRVFTILAPPPSPTWHRPVIEKKMALIGSNGGGGGGGEAQHNIYVEKSFVIGQ